MSELFVATSRNPGVLAQLQTAVSRELACLAPHLQLREYRADTAVATTAVNERTPCAVEQSPDGLVLVLGYGAGQTPREDAVQWLNGHARDSVRAGVSLSKALNYGAAASIRPGGDLVVITDYLGLYPMFVYSEPGLTICTSQLRLVRFAPRFKPTIDLKAVIGGLLLCHHCAGHTIWEGARRLRAHHVLWSSRPGDKQEVDCGLPAPPEAAGTFDDESHSLLLQQRPPLSPLEPP